MSPCSKACDWWFATAVMPRHEKSVQRILDYKGYKTSLPLRKTSHKRRCGSKWENEMPLISGYVFVSGESDSNQRIVSTPGVLKLIGFGGAPVPIPADQIEALERIAASPFPLSDCTNWKPGQAVELIDGPLKGLRGSIIRDAKTARFVVGVEVLQRSVAVEIEARWARPV